MPRGGEDNACQELHPSLQVIRSAAEAIWTHWGPWQEASVGWEDCGIPTPEPYPMAEPWDTPCGTERYAFRIRVTDLSAENISVELCTYDPCELLVSVSRVDQPRRVPLAESQASLLRLLSRDPPFRRAIFRRNEFAQHVSLQQEIAAREKDLAACLRSLDEGDQERIESLRQTVGVLCSKLAHLESRYQQQTQARQALNQQMADLQAQIARLRRQADWESDSAKARALRSEASVLWKQYEALRQQREQDGGGQAITVCVGVGGLNQTDRDAWRGFGPPEAIATGACAP